MTSTNFYIFCHWSVIIRKSMNTKDHEFNIELVILCAHRLPKHIGVGKIKNCVLWFTMYCTLLSAFVGNYIESITNFTTSPFLYLLIFFLCVCMYVCLALSFLSKGLVSALEAIIKGKKVPNGKALTTELQQCETLYNIKYHHKIFQCA
jgi:hypothetical protein